jgi:acyl-CoA thioester hydrolase
MMAEDAAVTPAEATVERRVEWHDTDAAGHQHHSAILRWAESAESELLRERGLAWLFGRTPRVRHEVNYRSRVWHGDVVRTRVVVEHVGRTSLRYSFEVTGPAGIAADGLVVIAHLEPEDTAVSPWPDEVRAALGYPVPTAG